ncbi:MAG TPA: flagellar hook-associated protein FlgL [Scandinavium sp.]|jgi:flagellar hook-associated protein 3 FlgL|uniref:flagellar hook-associated protein FlgL n=1 Tax=Scandinavium sp. TaxID=2830653 RepID=UPI002E34BA5E|nr:flagellar hook-associated protein FlgL [Scandinavium sp.]HEX4499782.1 flagellar hook-associated protein FlgL [Scandinavium sp.]
MRISSRYHSQAMLAQMNTNNERLSKLMEQMSTQKRVNVPSDDPVAATRLVQLNREQSAISQYQENISRLSGTLSVQESHIKAMSDNLLAINDKLLSANNSTYSQEDMSGYGVELGSMLDSLVDSLNAQNENGSYLFSGTKTDTKPIVLDEATGKYIYQGNDSTRSTTVANSVTVQENTNIASAFSSSGNDLDMLNQLKDLSEKMQDPNADFNDYQPQIKQVLELESDSRDKVSAMFTDLGGRQNQLTLLDNAHTDVSLANDQVVHDLSDTDWAATSMNMQLYVNSVQISNKAYSMVSQLSLFDTM